MKTFDTSILAVQTSTLTSGYRVLNALTKFEMHILDSSICGAGHFFILLAGKEKNLKSALAALPESEGFANSDIIERELIVQVHRNVLESVFSLSAQKLGQSMLMIETETIPVCLALANACASKHGLRAVETRIRRSAPGGAHTILTGSKEDVVLAAQECRVRLQHDMRNGKVEVIEEPTPELRSLFEFSAEN
jgi:hypothetical protein